MRLSTALPWIIIVILVIAFGYTATQHAPSLPPTVTTTQAVPAIQKVDVAMDFVPTGILVPFYVGVDQGFFAKYNLQVNLFPNPQGSTGAIRALAGHKADIANGDVGTLMVLMAKENITDVRAIGLYYAKTPQAIQFLIGKDRPSIKTPKDLENKTIGSFIGNGEEAEFPIFCKVNGIDCSKIKIEHGSVPTLNPGLLSGKFDAVLLFSRNVADLQPEASKQGLKVGNFAFADYGLDIYADMILTRTDVIQNNPDMIKKFLQGYYDALQFSVAHPDAAVASTLKFNPQLNANITRGEWDFTAEAMGGKAILNAKDPLTNGWIDPAKMQTTITTVSAAYSVRAPDSSAVYTNQFVKAR